MEMTNPEIKRLRVVPYFKDSCVTETAVGY